MESGGVAWWFKTNAAFKVSLRSLVKYLSTLEKKFLIPARPFNILYICYEGWQRKKKLPLLLPVSSMFCVRSFLWPTFSNVRAPDIWYLKTALSLNFFKSYSSTLPSVSWHVVHWGNGKVAVYVIFILRNKMNEDVKKMQKKEGNWGYKNMSTCFSHLLSWSLLYSRLRLSTLVSSSLEVKWYPASWFLYRWAKA